MAQNDDTRRDPAIDLPPTPLGGPNVRENKEPGREGARSENDRAAIAEGGARPEGHRVMEGPYSGGDPDLETPEGDIGGVFAEGSGPVTGTGTAGGSTGSGDFGSDGAGVGAGGAGGGVGKRERDADREAGADVIPIGEGGI